MIEEDYVSFETAKLLKEKGFPQSTFRCHYIIDGNVHYKSFENRCGFGDYDIIAPTLAVAMKWLREVHNINIDVVPIWNQKRFEYQIFVVTPENARHCYVDDKLYLGYEEACEAAIKYCLENFKL